VAKAATLLNVTHSQTHQCRTRFFLLPLLLLLLLLQLMMMIIHEKSRGQLSPQIVAAAKIYKENLQIKYSPPSSSVKTSEWRI
jgi:H+/Cl- antiporter ClcA